MVESLRRSEHYLIVTGCSCSLIASPWKTLSIKPRRLRLRDSSDIHVRSGCGYNYIRVALVSLVKTFIV